MRRLQPLHLAIALFVATAGPAGAQPATGHPSATFSYADALDDLEARRYRLAIERLNTVTAREPGNLGAVLDLAIAHCLAGTTDQAARIFLTLEARADLPPAIAEIIAYYRDGGCRPRTLGVQGFVSAGAGYARNLNLAPLAGLIWLPGLGLELALQESSRPRHAGFAQMEAGAVAVLSENQSWTAGFYAQGIQYRNAPEYRLGTLQASLNYRQRETGRHTEAQLAYARLWLGGTTHLDAAVVNGAALARLHPHWSVGPSFAVNQLTYRELSAFDSRQFEMRARAQWQRADLHLALEAGWHQDQPLADRPGGNRRGPVAQAKTHWEIDEANLLDVTVRQTWLQDSAPYSPPLFGALQRAPKQTSIHAVWRRTLAPGLNGRVEYRYQGARDPIALFTYDTHSVGVALEWVFFR